MADSCSVGRGSNPRGAIRAHSIMVSTPPLHGGNQGSTPCGSMPIWLFVCQKILGYRPPLLSPLSIVVKHPAVYWEPRVQFPQWAYKVGGKVHRSRVHIIKPPLGNGSLPGLNPGHLCISVRLRVGA